MNTDIQPIPVKGKAQDFSQENKMMRAIVFHQYGDPKEVMALVNDREIPKPNANEVLVKAESSSVNAADRHMVRANYLIVRLVLGLFRPAEKNRVLGMDIAGTIQAIGESVEGFQVRDAVPDAIHSLEQRAVVGKIVVNNQL